ncbi:hypothetical protein Tco_1526720, partial [Tanacetum coccineum]
DKGEPTLSFVVLISLLKPLDRSRWPSPSSNESFATRNMKFSGLVVKCLVKLKKTLATARMLTPTGPTAQTTYSMANNRMPAAHSADAQLKIDIFSQLQNTSEAFEHTLEMVATFGSSYVLGSMVVLLI